jgi:hypothetical protein
MHEFRLELAEQVQKATSPDSSRNSPNTSENPQAGLHLVIVGLHLAKPYIYVPPPDSLFLLSLVMKMSLRNGIECIELIEFLF